MFFLRRRGLTLHDCKDRLHRGREDGGGPHRGAHSEECLHEGRDHRMRTQPGDSRPHVPDIRDPHVRDGLRGRRQDEARRPRRQAEAGTPCVRRRGNQDAGGDHRPQPGRRTHHRQAEDICARLQDREGHAQPLRRGSRGRHGLRDGRDAVPGGGIGHRLRSRSRRTRRRDLRGPDGCHHGPRGELTCIPLSRHRRHGRCRRPERASEEGCHPPRGPEHARIRQDGP